MSSKKPPMPAKQAATSPAPAGDFDALVTSIVSIHQQTQDVAAKAVNVTLTLRNWLIGCRIVAFEQRGNDRAAYGERLLDNLAQRLASQGLPRVTPRELRRYRQFYQVYPRMWESLTPESQTVETLSPHPSAPQVTEQMTEQVTAQVIRLLVALSPRAAGRDISGLSAYAQ